MARLRPGTRVVAEGGVEPTDLRDAPLSTSPDMLAYYLPYHFYRRGSWGIYLRAAGIEWLARGLKGTDLEPRDDTFRSAARRVLLEHEYYHCVVETAATRAEFAATQPAYGEYFQDWATAAHEEALANAHAFAIVRRSHPGLTEPLRKWMRAQPEGYRDFETWLGRAFERGRGQAAQYMLRRLPAGALTRPLVGGEYLVTKVPASRIPMYLVLERSAGNDVLRPFPRAVGMRAEVHTRDHPPPHFHLEAPISTERGRFEWPSLAPLEGTRPLSADERKRLSQYLDRFGGQIAKKISAVYGTALATASI